MYSHNRALRFWHLMYSNHHNRPLTKHRNKQLTIHISPILRRYPHIALSLLNNNNKRTHLQLFKFRILVNDANYWETLKLDCECRKFAAVDANASDATSRRHASFRTERVKGCKWSVYFSSPLRGSLWTTQCRRDFRSNMTLVPSSQVWIDFSAMHTTTLVSFLCGLTTLTKQFLPVIATESSDGD